MAGCGTSSSTSPAELALEREDLIFVAHALQSASAQAGDEVAGTKAAWPYIYNGLPPAGTGIGQAQIDAAIEDAERLTLPPLLHEARAAALTGPASSLAGLYRSFSELSSRAWVMLGANIEQIERGSPKAASFARATVALYIDSIYDAHFGLAQIGKQLLPAYTKLGGAGAFGSSLSQSVVDSLAATYSEANDRLVPHVNVTLGS